MQNADIFIHQNRDPYILVLINGDGMLFSNDFLCQGEAGGKQAALVLSEKISQWAAENVMECPTDVKIVVRVYANVKAMKEACLRIGMVDKASKVDDFVLGFTRCKTLCDFTDVGPGKDVAAWKIYGRCFKLSSGLPQGYWLTYVPRNLQALPL